MNEKDRLCGECGQASPTPSNPELQAKVDAVPYWYHAIDLPGAKTYGPECKSPGPGWSPGCPVEGYKIPADLTGKRVLDIGAWDGFWTFEALKRGASEVVAVDDFSDISNFRDLPGWYTFDLCREALGYTDRECPRHEMSVYDITEERLGRFDVVFFLGVLYHCRYPLLAMDKVSAVADGELYIESAVLDRYSPYCTGDGWDRQGYDGKQMVMEFYPDDQYANNATNWWAPTLFLLGWMAKAAGWPNAQGWLLEEDPKHVSRCRGHLKAWRDGKGEASE